MTSRLARVDAALCRTMRRLPHGGFGDTALAALSRATDHAIGWIVLGLAGAAVDRQHADAWRGAVLTVSAAEHASVVVKGLTRRPRPHLDGLPPLASTPSPLSFPSSHTASAVAAALVFGPLLSDRALWAGAVVMALSRPYLGVHYPSDVLAGAALGHVVGSVGRRLISNGRNTISATT